MQWLAIEFGWWCEANPFWITTAAGYWTAAVRTINANCTGLRVHERVSTNKLCKSRKGSFNTQFQQAIPSVSPRECDQGLQKGHALQIPRNRRGMWQTEVEEEEINTVQTFLSAEIYSWATSRSGFNFYRSYSSFVTSSGPHFNLSTIKWDTTVISLFIMTQEDKPRNWLEIAV